MPGEDTWVVGRGDPGFRVGLRLRRAKLMLDAVDPDTTAAALRCGRLLARLRLTDACGRPLCAQVRPPLVEWSAPARWPDPVA
ncbi:DUF5990 family protein [Streptomyces sp. NPDC085929]|uniref:DUF5990 family protein n=1 Tax=Streptomyces sp. NPDC085929 TaxID=3365739 RepID=UPI0037CDE262